MNLSSNKWRLAAVGAATALVLAACGDGGTSDDDDDDDNGPGEAAGEFFCGVDPDGTVESEGDADLVLGMLLPQTGSLAFLGPPEFAGVDLAIQEINAAGGVLGGPVSGAKADSGDGEPNIAPAEVDKLFAEGAQVIIGAAASGVSFTVIDKITGAGVVQFSPANTSPLFDEYDHGGLYFRTAPSDVLQGAVLANLAAQDGVQNLAILARQDDYGEALANQVESEFQAAGGTVASKVLFDPTAATFDSEIQQIANSSPDGLVLIAFDETARIIPALVSAGAGQGDGVQTYFVDGNLAAYDADSDNPLDEGVLEGVKGTLPGGDLPDVFRDCLLEVDPSLTEFAYAGESYDAAIVSALAALQAGSTDGEAIAAEIPSVTGGGGTKCYTYYDCASLIVDGEDVDYDGISGPIEIGETGSPTVANIGIYEYGSDNTFENVDYVEGNL